MGLLDNLFPRKTKYVGEADTKAARASSSEYFLDSDLAKGLGDVEYMRTAKSVRKTFPKGKGVNPTNQAVSSLETATEKPTVIESPSSPAPVKSVSSTDSNLDLFRQMAREVKR